MLTLADLPAAGSPDAVNWLVITTSAAFAGASMVAYNVVGIWARLRRQPPIEREFATKTELDATNKRVERIELRIEQMFQQQLAAGEQRSAAIHKRIDGIADMLSDLGAKISTIAGRCAAMHGQPMQPPPLPGAPAPAPRRIPR